jgi:VanZ family protein
MKIPIPDFARRPTFWWTSFAAWFLLLFGLSSMSGGPHIAPPFMISDKIAHACYFTAGSAAFALALGLALAGDISISKTRLLVACLLMAALVGVFDEWHQSHTPGRDGNSWGDWIADVLGGGLGFCLALFLLPKLRNEPTPCS